MLSETEWAANVDQWLPSEADRAYVASLMGRVVETGKIRELDRAAGDRHQQAAGRLRIRALQLTRHLIPLAVSDDHRHPRQAAPDRPRGLHPLQHLRGDLPGRRDHARRPQLRRRRRRSATRAMPASRRARPAASTTGCRCRRRKPFTLDEQFGWDELPSEDAARQRGADAAGAAARSCSRPAVAAPSGEVDDAEPQQHNAAVSPTSPRAPWSAAHPYLNLHTLKKPIIATVAGNFRLTAADAESDVRHIVLDFGTHFMPAARGPVGRRDPAGRRRAAASRTTCACTRWRARAAASARATTTSR